MWEGRGGLRKKRLNPAPWHGRGRYFLLLGKFRGYDGANRGGGVSFLPQGRENRWRFGICLGNLAKPKGFGPQQGACVGRWSCPREAVLHISGLLCKLLPEALQHAPQWRLGTAHSRSHFNLFLQPRDMTDTHRNTQTDNHGWLQTEAR